MNSTSTAIDDGRPLPKGDIPAGVHFVAVPDGNCDGAFLDGLSRRYRVDLMVRWEETVRNCAGKDPAWLGRLFRRWAIPTKRGGLVLRPGQPIDGRVVE